MATRKSNQVQTAVLVDEEMLNLLDEMADREHLSRSDIIRRLIRRGLEMERLLSNSQPERRAC